MFTWRTVSLARPDHNAKAYGLVTLPHRSCSSGMCSVHKKKSPTNSIVIIMQLITFSRLVGRRNLTGGGTDAEEVLSAWKSP